MNSRSEHPRIPDLKLERFLLRELDPEETDEIQRRLDEDGALRRRLEGLKSSNRDILDRYPAPMMAAEIRRRLGAGEARKGTAREARRTSFLLVPALSMAVAAIIILLLLPPPAEWFQGEQPEPHIGLRIKGLEPQIRLFRKTETGSERLENGAVAGKGDLILVQYDAAGTAYGVIFSMDGRGVITIHAPLDGSSSLRLQQGGPVSLGFSYELDDAPRWERFYFVTSDSVFDVDVVLTAAREMASQTHSERGDSLRLPNGLHQAIFTLEKETSHE